MFSSLKTTPAPAPKFDDIAEFIKENGQAMDSVKYNCLGCVAVQGVVNVNNIHHGRAAFP